MDRRIVYNRYVSSESCERKIVGRTVDLKTGIEYAIYETTDKHIKFCLTHISSKSYEKLETYVLHNRYLMFKPVIPREFEGAIVLGIIINDALKIKPKIYHIGLDVGIDFSDCDLSNVLSIDKQGAGTPKFLLKFPDDEEKRFKPVSTRNLFAYAGDNWIHREIRKIDLSYVEDGHSMFYSSGLTSFDFTHSPMGSLRNAKRMFWGSLILEQVSGSIGAREINADEMFYDCIELTQIDDDLFYGCQLTDISSIIYDCEKLNSIKFLLGRLGGIHNKYLGSFNMYSFYGFHDELIELFKEALNNNNTVENAFLFAKKNICFGKFKYKVNFNIFSALRCQVDLVDLSECEFEYDKNSPGFGVTGLFVKNQMVRGLKSGVESDAELTKLAERIKNDKVEGIPKIVIINPTIRLSDIDSKIFNIVDMHDFKREEALMKLNFIKAVGLDERYLLIVS